MSPTNLRLGRFRNGRGSKLPVNCDHEPSWVSVRLLKAPMASPCEVSAYRLVRVFPGGANIPAKTSISVSNAVKMRRPLIENVETPPRD